MSKHMGEVIIALILLLSGGIAGNQIGKGKAQREAAKVQAALSHDIRAANDKLDSLAQVPAKVDTVIKVTTRTEMKVDTLVLLNGQVLKNTELILRDTKAIKDSLKFKE